MSPYWKKGTNVFRKARTTVVGQTAQCNICSEKTWYRMSNNIFRCSTCGNELLDTKQKGDKTI